METTVEQRGTPLPGNVIAHTRNFDEARLARKLDEELPDNSRIRITGVMVVGYFMSAPTTMRVVLRYLDTETNTAVAAPWDLSLALIEQYGALVSD